MLITSSAYLENVFLFTLTKIKLQNYCFCLFRVADLALAMVAALLLVLGQLPWIEDPVSPSYIHAELLF